MSNIMVRNIGLVLTASAVLLVLAPMASASLVVTLADEGSVARIDLEDGRGMFDWEVNGVDQLKQQWFWFRIGDTGPERALGTDPGTAGLTLKTWSATSNYLDVTYQGSGFEIRITYSLMGGQVVADISEQIRIKNTSGGPLDFHFFQYSDFDLLGSAGDDIVEFSDVRAIQRNGYATIWESETSAIPSADRREAGIFGQTLGKLNDGVADDLNNVLSIPTPNDVTWAFQWDEQLAAGQTMVISKDKLLTVPEPTTMAFLAAGGLLAIGATIRRRRSAR